MFFFVLSRSPNHFSPVWNSIPASLLRSWAWTPATDFTILIFQQIQSYPFVSSHEGSHPDCTDPELASIKMTKNITVSVQALAILRTSISVSQASLYHFYSRHGYRMWQFMKEESRLKGSEISRSREICERPSSFIQTSRTFVLASWSR